MYDLTTDLAVVAAANGDDEATPLDITNAQFHTRRRLATAGKIAARIIADFEDEAAK